MAKATTPVPTSNLPALKPSVDAILKRMKALKAETWKEADRANTFLKDVKSTAKEIKAAYKKEAGPLECKLRPLKAAKKALLDPLKEAEDTIKSLLLAWTRAEALRLAEEQAKLLAKETKKLERSGMDHDEAQALASTLPAASAANVEPTKLAGTTILENWQATLVDLGPLLSAILEGSVSSEYLLFNTSFANAQAKALRDPSKAPPGVLFEDIGSVRSRA